MGRRGNENRDEYEEEERIKVCILKYVMTKSWPTFVEEHQY